MNGAFPPSSSETRFTVSAAAAIRDLPTRVEPVKPIFRTVSDSSSFFPSDKTRTVKPHVSLQLFADTSFSQSKQAFDFAITAIFPIYH